LIEDDNDQFLVGDKFENGIDLVEPIIFVL